MRGEVRTGPKTCFNKPIMVVADRASRHAPPETTMPLVDCWRLVLPHTLQPTKRLSIAPTLLARTTKIYNRILSTRFYR